MYLEASQPTRPGDNAAVTSPTLKRSLDHMCLQFFYHMNGKDTGWLRVLLTVDNEETKEVARISGQQEYGWRPMLVDIPSLRGKLRVRTDEYIHVFRLVCHDCVVIHLPLW